MMFFMKEVNIQVHRGDKREVTIEEGGIGISSLKEENLSKLRNEDTSSEVKNEEISSEEQYVHELEKVFDAYVHYSKEYKRISKQLMNPWKARKLAGQFFRQIIELGNSFNQSIATFKELALVPTEDLQPIHEKLLESLDYFVVYNNEYPDAIQKGNFKRITELSKGLDKGQKGIKEVFELLEEREKQKG